MFLECVVKLMAHPVWVTKFVINPSLGCYLTVQMLRITAIEESLYLSQSYQDPVAYTGAVR